MHINLGYLTNKRYWLFHGDDYYPGGGMVDFKKRSDCLNDLLNFTNKMESHQWAHIYDIQTEKIIFESKSVNWPYEKNKFQWIEYEHELDKCKT